ncbi:MAG: D-alanyl-D-alanine carboxypeptidase [Firmicutes bacterium]|nr:D-alanyl-D-alanine carboxypeptidase [Bacillota bacterium]
MLFKRSLGRKILFTSFLFCFFNPYVYSLHTSAKSAVAICADSWDIIWSKNEDQKLPMASTTKIMTSLLALEEAAIFGNRDIEITEEMIKVEGTSMGLRAGDVVSLEALAQGMLLPSGNDAANAAAISVCGSIEKFLEKMNERAKQIGMKNTNFCTPSGLDYGDHHSTALDMAILGAYAMENENFAKIVSKRYATVNFSSKKIKYKNHNKLLKFYKYCRGIKTGFTKLAGRCLVSCSVKDGIMVVVVTLDAPDDWNDHIAIYDYSFDNISTEIFNDLDYRNEIEIKNGDIDKIKVKGSTSSSRTFSNKSKPKITRKVDIPDKLDAPIKKGQCIGKIKYFHNDKVIAENLIVSDQNVNVRKKMNFFGPIFNFIKNIFVGTINFVKNIFN